MFSCYVVVGAGASADQAGDMKSADASLIGTVCKTEDLDGGLLTIRGKYGGYEWFVVWGGWRGLLREGKKRFVAWGERSDLLHGGERVCNRQALVGRCVVPLG